MIMRMRMAGELVSPARGLYTTSGHPCLASFPDPSSTSQADPTPSPVPIVPSSDHSTDIPSLELSPASTVPTSLSTSAIPPTAAFAKSSNHVPIVPHPLILQALPSTASIEQLQAHIQKSLEEHGDVDSAAFAKLCSLLQYVSGDYHDAAT